MAEQTSLTRVDFEELVLEYINDEPLPAETKAQLAELEANDPECRELADAMREAIGFAGVLPELVPPEHVHQKILELAREPARPMLFPRLIEPIGWAAAASLLLSCGFVLGAMTQSTSTTGVAVVDDDRGGGKAQTRRDGGLKADGAVASVAEVFRELGRSESSQPIDLSGQGEAGWTGIRQVQSTLPQAERLMRSFDETGEVGDLQLAEALLSRSERLVSEGKSLDGLLPVNSSYKERAERLRVQIRARLRKVESGSDGG